jgi:ATP-dependent exoDNAse (exonuclease V) alpha subunit
MNTAPLVEREALAGLVERVTFHNPETGFCVLRVRVRGQRDLVTVVGAAAAVSAGEFIQASGIWLNDRTHGLQFKAAFLKTAPPTTLEGIERYLGSGMVKGIGPVYVEELVAAFGKDLFLPHLSPHDTIWLMNKLLERAIAELAALPEDQQEAVAARLLEEVERQTSSKGKWAKVADRLARLDLFQGKSQQFVERTREFRDSFSLHGPPNS